VSEVGAAVTACGEAARAGAAALASAPAGVIDEALRGMATLLTQATGQVLDANAADVAAGQRAGLGAGLLDRLQLDEDRIAGMAGQIGQLAAVPFPPAEMPVRDLPGGLRLAERRIPVGVIGANYEARPNVTVDIASQLLKSRNAGVLRTGGAALRSAAALFDHVIVPAVAAAGLDPRALQLVRSADRAAATELVRRPGLIPLVILRGSGTTTRDLAAEAARHGVRTLAHADGGGVLYLDAAADPALTAEVIGASLDRLGVCNRLNLLLIHEAAWDALLPVTEAALAARGVVASLPPHSHPVGHEWALDDGREATSWPPMPAPARSGMPAPGCWTGSSCAVSRKPGSTSTMCPARAAR